MRSETHLKIAAAANGRAAARDNVIILTGGLTGSSALAGLLSAAGYWSGEDTFKKRDYNTYENAELIRLNRQLMQRVSVGEDYTKRFVPRAIASIAALAGGEPDGEYRALVADCDSHAPWMWKDPRLWLTIRLRAAADVAADSRASAEPRPRAIMDLVHAAQTDPDIRILATLQRGDPALAAPNSRRALDPLPAGGVRGPDRDAGEGDRPPGAFSMPTSGWSTCTTLMTARCTGRPRRLVMPSKPD
jgi:hypothetical protein